MSQWRPLVWINNFIGDHSDFHAFHLVQVDNQIDEMPLGEAVHADIQRVIGAAHQ